jgi:hypothetical protein
MDTTCFLIDFHVRWNTTYLMLERFYEIKIVVDGITCNPQLIQGISKKQERNLKNLILKAKNWEKWGPGIEK